MTRPLGDPIDINDKYKWHELKEGGPPSFPDGTVQRLVVDRFGDPKEHQVDMSLLDRH